MEKPPRRADRTVPPMFETHGCFVAAGLLGLRALVPVTEGLEQLVATGGRVRAKSANARRLLESCPQVAALARHPAVRGLVDPVLGVHAFPVRGLLFDKAASSNWHVGWHQDVMIPVQRHVEAAGFGPWNRKAGVLHVRPPAEVLAGMLTLRIHVDDCPEDNGPLQVLPGTHRLGIVAEAHVRRVSAQRGPVTCTAAAGDVLVMRPLLMHASRPAATPRHRRVVHLEFAAQELPGELEWHRPLG